MDDRQARVGLGRDVHRGRRAPHDPGALRRSLRLPADGGRARRRPHAARGDRRRDRDDHAAARPRRRLGARARDATRRLPRARRTTPAGDRLERLPGADRAGVRDVRRALQAPRAGGRAVRLRRRRLLRPLCGARGGAGVRAGRTGALARRAGDSLRAVSRPVGRSRRSRLMLDEPHHDGSDLYVVERPDAIGGHATLRVRTPRGTAERVLVRYVADGESHLAEATIDEENGHETWWRASFAALNAATRYRWLLSGGRTGYQWLNGTGLAPRDR